MAERQSSKMERKRERQPISVPFIWEEKPGMPKKDWQPTARPVEPVAPPIKLVVSVPFEWEEKPGIPNPDFVQSPEDSIISSSPPRYPRLGTYSITKPVTPPVKLVVSVPFQWEEKPGKPIPGFIQSPEEPIISSSPSRYPGEDDNDGREGLSGSNSETCNFTKPVMSPVKFVASIPFEWEEKPGIPIPGFTQRSTEPTFAPSCEHRLNFSSTPRYLGQGDDERDELSDSEIDVWSSATDDSFPSAIRLQETCIESTAVNSGPLQSPGSPISETDSTSSYATGTASLVGSSFLEWLFPLLVPNSKFETKVEKNDCQADVQVKDVLQESRCSQVKRPLLTLEELIVMSRRMSCKRKVAKMQKQTSMDFIKRNTFGCGIFGSGESIIGLHRKWKRQLQLKLI